MMKKILLLLAFISVFLFLGISAMKDGMPEAKNEKVYKSLKLYIPYTLEKRVGGYSILKKGSDVKEKPPAKDVFLRLDQLEKQWGKEHLKLNGNILEILDKNKNIIKKFRLNTEEITWVKTFFML